MTAPSLPGERPTLRSVAPAPLLTALLATLAVAGAVARVPQSERVPLSLGAGAGAVLLTLAVAVAAHAVQTTRLTRRRLEMVGADTGRLLQDRIRQSAEFDQERVRLTEELTHERSRVSAEIAQERARLSAEFGQERARLSVEFSQERGRLTAENARLAEQARRAGQDRAAAIAATANAAGRMQALATGTLADLRSMEERHADEDVLADLLHLDHRTAQAGRLADSVAVLTGARSGRRWARPIAMESILRGAMGRISGYQRVRVHSASDAAVAGHAAEGVMHALAELLDNAANFSPPTAEVHVYVEEVPAGVIVSVEDSGLVMGDVQLRRAERAVSGDAGELGGLTGTRLGLAVVGRLARKYGLKVSYRPSARGGTGVLMLIPQDILVPHPYAPRPQDPATLPKAEASGKPAAGRTGTTPPGEAKPQLPAEPPATGTPEMPGDWQAGAPGKGTPQPPADGTAWMPADGKPWPSGDGTPRVPADGPAWESYDAHHASDGLDPDPVPTHESPDRGADALPEGLPKRRKGQALAEAERERERARARAAEFDHDRERTRARAADPGPDAPVSLDDSLTRAERFSSFRRAVRGSQSDQGAPAPDTTDTPDGPAPADERERVVAVRRSPPHTRPVRTEPHQQTDDPSAAGSPHHHDPDPQRT